MMWMMMEMTTTFMTTMMTRNKTTSLRNLHSSSASGKKLSDENKLPVRKSYDHFAISFHDYIIPNHRFPPQNVDVASGLKEAN